MVINAAVRGPQGNDFVTLRDSLKNNKNALKIVLFYTRFGVH
jgi:hypothetical protein